MPPQDSADECEVAAVPASPLGLHLVIDESLAMVFPRDLWTPLGEALDAFAASEGAARFAIGAQFFSGACDPGEYAAPQLPLEPATERVALLAQSMSDRRHAPGAATGPALAGAIAYAQGWSSASAQRAAVVLISGSEPSGCAGDAATAADAAAQGLAGTPAVPTYVLALRAQAGLDQIAQHGGTGAALSPDAATAAALAGALDELAGRALCEIALPATAAPYLPDAVNVRMTRDGTAAFVPRVDGPDACAATVDGFYFDDAQNPTRVVLCPQSCASARSGANVELAFGCPSVR